jgi:hypothetical protein
MNLPPNLLALQRLIAPFHDEPTLRQLAAELDVVTAALAPLPAPAAPAAAGGPAAAPAPADFQLADRLREAVGTYIIRIGPRPNWVRCTTPGCRDGWRGP